MVPSRHPASQAGPLLLCLSSSKPPRHLARPLSHVVPCLGAAPPEDHPGGCPRMACLVGSGPGHLGLLSLTDNSPFHVSSEEAKQNNPTLAPSSPSCLPPSFACCERVSCPAGHLGTAGGALGQRNKALGRKQDSGASSGGHRGLKLGCPRGLDCWTVMVKGCRSC